MKADFVIVGSGSAGAAMAARLTEESKYSVIMIEAGGTDAGPFIQMPAALSYPMNMRLYDWGFQSEPEPHLNNRRLATPRGKVIGGSSSINGMVYVRGHAHDFDTWAEMGADGWAYADVLPYFQRLENSHGGQPGWRGTDGPMHVTRGSRTNPLYTAFVEAGRQAGYELTEDYNGEKQEGFGPFEMTVWQGRRWSTANAYLRPALKRKNLVLLRGEAQKVVVEDGRAIGVDVLHGGRVQTIHAGREVILAASSINSPKLLLLSGIGPAEELKQHDIAVVADRPGVGRNLQDHLELYVQQGIKQPITLNGRLGLISKGLIGLQWLTSQTGLGATNHFESCAFIRSRAGIPYPDIQFHFLAGAIRYDGKAAAPGHGCQAHVGPMRSKSRGTVKLKSSNPGDAPEIRFNYMSHEEDWKEFRTAIRLVREVFGQHAFDELRGEEIQPSADIQSDEALDAFIAEHSESAYHPCGTCKMGRADDRDAVVDPRCRVIGVDGLRVADSSIFPQITNGNLNAPSIMVGERASDHILGRDPLPRSNLTPWVHPKWQEQQR